MNPKPLNPPTVFVVDDDRQMLDSLTALLAAMKFTARAFASAEEFHRFYVASMPGCLVLDVKMPVQDGLELYEQLVQEGKRLPVIFITAHADVSTAVAAMKTGAIEFLEKPFARELLLDRVQKALALDTKWRNRDAEYGALDERIRSPDETRTGDVGAYSVRHFEQIDGVEIADLGTRGRNAPRRHHAQTANPVAGRIGGDGHHPPHSRRNPPDSLQFLAASLVPPIGCQNLHDEPGLAAC